MSSKKFIIEDFNVDFEKKTIISCPSGHEPIVSFDGSLKDYINYEIIDYFTFKDSALGVKLLNQCMNIYMNYPFTINGECMFDRCVTSEIDNDTFGFLLVRKHDEKIASTFVFFDYVRMQKIDDGIEILYRSADLCTETYIPGSVKLKDNKNEISIIGDKNLVNLRKGLFEKFFENLDDALLEKNYIKFCETLTNELMANIDNSKEIEKLIKKVLLSEEIWIHNKSKLINNSFKMAKLLFESLCANLNSYSNNLKCIIIKSWCYCLKNIDTIFSSNGEYLYPYVVIKATNDDIIEIKVEETKENNKGNQVFEIINY